MKIFDALLESWFMGNMNLINTSPESAFDKLRAFEILEKEKLKYQKDFEDVLKVLKTPAKDLPLLIGNVEYEEAKEILEERLKE